MKFIFSAHAIEEMSRRKTPKRIVDEVLQSPGQVVALLDGTKAYQSKIPFERGRVFLVRAIVDAYGTVITVYRTSKIDDYWESEK